MEMILIILVVALAAIYLLKTISRGAKSNNNCECDCSSCPPSDDCPEKDKPALRQTAPK